MKKYYSTHKAKPVIFAAFTIILLQTFGCSKTAAVKGIIAATSDVETTVTTTTTGTVEAVSQAVLGFSQTGRVASIHITAGAKLKKAQILAELENRDLRAIMTDAVTDGKRSDELFEARLVSKTALEQSKKALEIATANFERSIIRAPYDGSITEVNLELGELAGSTSAKAPMRIVDNRPRIVKGDIDEIDLAKVKAGAEARIKIAAVRPEHFSAKVSSIVPFVSTLKDKDRTAAVEFSVDSLGLAIPVGASADIEIIVQKKPNALAIPTKCLLGTGTNRYVYKTVDDKAVKSTVTIGIGNYEKTEILTGLAAGETVLFPPEDVELKDGLKVKVEIKK